MATGDTRPEAPPAAASPDPGQGVYQVWRAAGDYRGAGWGEPRGQYESLTTAMRAAGHRDFADWGTRPEMPDTLFLAAAATLNTGESSAAHVPPWTIEGRNVAREFAETCPGIVRTATCWSRHDERIIAAVIGETRSRADWRLPFAAAIDAAALLAARYGTSREKGGSLTTVDVFTVLSRAYAGAYPDTALPPDVADSIARDVVRRLTGTGVVVIGGQAALLASARLPDPGQMVVIGDGKTRQPQVWPNAPWFASSPRLAAAAEKVVNTVVAVLAAAEICRLAMLAAIGRGFQAAGRWWEQAARTLHVVTVPAGPLPWWLCAAVSYTVSHLLIPFGLPFLGVWLTCWPATWHELAARWVPVAGWVTAGFVAEKLVGFQLRPAKPAPDWTRGLASGPTMVASFALIAVAAAWPWSAWWATHLHLRVFLSVMSGIMAVSVAAVMITRARRRARPGRP